MQVKSNLWFFELNFVDDSNFKYFMINFMCQEIWNMLFFSLIKLIF